MKALVIGFFLAVSFSSHAKMPGSGAEFCEKLRADAPSSSDSRSLGHVGKALGLEQGALGPNAKDSAPEFAKQGFKNLLDTDPGLLSDESKIPVGAVLVLDKTKSPSCPITARIGHVPVKCGPNLLYWVAGQTKKLSDFIGQNPKCIKAVMYNPKWSKPQKHSEAPADSNTNAVPEG